MHANRANGVVYMKFDVEQFDDTYHEQTGDKTDHRSTEGVNGVAACCHSDESCERAVYAHRNVGLTVLYPREYHCGAGGNGGCDRCRNEYRRKGSAVPCRGSVEPVPAEPQYEAPESSERYRMAGKRIDLCHFSCIVLNILTEPRTYHYSPDQRCDTADRMDRCRSGKIVKTELCEPAVCVPYPARFDGVNEKRDHA